MPRRCISLSAIFSVCLCLVPAAQSEAQETDAGATNSHGFSGVLRDIAKAPVWIWRTGKGSFGSENLRYWGLAAGATGLAYLFDSNLDAYVKRERPSADAARFFDKTGHRLNLGLWAAAYAAGRVLNQDKLIRTGKALIVSQLSATLIGNALWFSVGRERPDTAPDHHTFHPFASDNLTFAFPPFNVLPSFPSAHTSGNFGIATVITRYYGLEYGLPIYAFGTAVGFSRIARQGHFLSDVVAGAFLGTLTAIAATKVIDSQSQPGKTMTWLPRIGRNEVGLVVLVPLQ